MWILTRFGFFSVVQKEGTSFLTVRARVREDLDALRQHYLPTLSPTQSKGGTDYPWRATVSHEDLGAAMVKIVADLHYANFKNEVAKTQGKARAHTYGKVWDVLYGLPIEGVPAPDLSKVVPAAALPWSMTVPAGKKAAYGGVLFDEEGRVLLREPLNHYDGYVWTFAKGRPDPGESPQQAAIREVKEETGVEGEILAAIPGEFVGGTTLNRYFLMSAKAGTPPTKHSCEETRRIAWVTPEEAVGMISQTTNPTGRKRDLAVLEAALKLRKD